MSFQSDLQCAISIIEAVLTRLIREDSGQDLIEYALVFSFVALGAVASMKSLGSKIAVVFDAVGTTLTSAT